MSTALHAVELAATYVGVTLRSASGHVTERADILIGADGRASTTRGLAGFKLEIRVPGPDRLVVASGTGDAAVGSSLSGFHRPERIPHPLPVMERAPTSSTCRTQLIQKISRRR
jgi:2-polyprenyl-6-methoxyphenol hydroxylase-like FAD-dependent oxidoreductase